MVDDVSDTRSDEQRVAVAQQRIVARDLYVLTGIDWQVNENTGELFAHCTTAQRARQELKDLFKSANVRLKGHFEETSMGNNYLALRPGYWPDAIREQAVAFIAAKGSLDAVEAHWSLENIRHTSMHGPSVERMREMLGALVPDTAWHAASPHGSELCSPVLFSEVATLTPERAQEIEALFNRLHVSHHIVYDGLKTDQVGFRISHFTPNVFQNVEKAYERHCKAQEKAEGTFSHVEQQRMRGEGLSWNRGVGPGRYND